jgi:hypothetical protein
MQTTSLRSARVLTSLSLLTLAASLAPADAQFITQTNGGAITITGYTGPGGDLAIPAILNGLPVTAIGPQSFYGKTSLTSVTISNGVANIGQDAFYVCGNITNLSLPGSLTNIGTTAFYSCASLVSVTIPAGVESLGDSVFQSCGALTAINVDPANAAYSSVGGVLFDKGQSTLLEAPGHLTGGYVIPNTVTAVGLNAFWGCASLTGVTLPTNLASLGNSAFAYCGLASVTIPGSVTNIGVSAFLDCSNLTAITVATNNPAFASTGGVLFTHDRTSILQYPPAAVAGSYVIPNAVTQIAQSAFGYCGNLTTVTIPGSVTDIGYGAFQYCPNLAAVTVPDSVTNLGDLAFDHCSGLGVATIGSGVKNIGNQALAYCYSLTNVTLAGTVTNLGVEAFYQCQSLTSFTLPAAVTSIGFQTFAACFNLSSLTLSPSLATIDADAFESSGLTNLTIPASVTNIGSSVFQSCQQLTNITVDGSNPAYSSVDGVLFDRAQTTLIRYPAGKTANSYAIPNGVISIAQGAFAISPNLNNVTFPNGLASLGQFAFANCLGLTSVTLPASVTNLDAYAFSVCYNLTGIYFYGNAPVVTPQSFYSDSATVYYLPGTTGWGSMLGSLSTAPWLLPNPIILTGVPTFGVHSNSFGFTISWAANLPVIVQAATDLAQPVWTNLATNTLSSGTSFFSDPTWTNASKRFYRVSAQ